MRKNEVKSRKVGKHLLAIGCCCKEIVSKNIKKHVEHVK